MLRVLAGSSGGRQRLTGYYSRHQFSGAPLSRSFFSFGSQGDNDSDNNSSGNGGSNSNGDDNDKKPDDTNKSTESLPSSNMLSEVVPSKLKYGDEAPRYPHTLGLPLVSRPLFPGVFTSVTVSDPATLEALERLIKVGQSAYVSTFLRKNHPTGVSEGGVLLPTPEVITDPADLYKVGSFAQIHNININRGLGSAARGSRPFMDSRAMENHKNNGKSEDSDREDEENEIGTVLLLAHRRVDLESVDKLGPPIDVTVSHWKKLQDDYAGSSDTIRALSNEIITTIREVAQTNQLFRENLTLFPMRVDANDPFRLADFAASISSAGSPEDLQAVLEEKDAEMRLHKALV